MKTLHPSLKTDNVVKLNKNSLIPNSYNFKLIVVSAVALILRSLTQTSKLPYWLNVADPEFPLDKLVGEYASFKTGIFSAE